MQGTRGQWGSLACGLIPAQAALGAVGAQIYSGISALKHNAC